MKKLALIALAIILAKCSMAQPPNVPADKGSNFGDKVSAANAISVEQLYSKMQDTKSTEKKMDVVVKGIVTDVCQKEGCWIKIQSPNGKMMVRMKDHEFMVPVALNGKTVLIEGTAEEKITSVEQLKHFAEDAGKPKAEIDAIKEPKKEIIIQAKGVLVV